MSQIPNFSLKLLPNTLQGGERVHRKMTLGQKRKKRGGGGITPRLPYHFPNIFYTKPDKKITFFLTILVVFSLSIELDEEFIETNCCSNLYTDCI